MDSFGEPGEAMQTFIRTTAMIWALALSPSGTSWAWDGRFDIPKLCEKSGAESIWGLASIGEAKKEFPEKALVSGSTDEVFAEVTRYCSIQKHPECLELAPWILLTSPRFEVRLAAHRLQLDLAQKFLTAHGYGTDVETELRKAQQSDFRYSPDAVAQVHAVLAEAARFDDYKESFEKGRLVAPILCAPYLDYGCIHAVEDALVLGQVGRLKSQAMITMMPAILRLFTDLAHRKAAPLAAIRITEKVLAAQKGEPISGEFFSDLYSDLLRAYRDSGNSEKRSRDLVFDFLAFYGARGASMELATELANSENYPVMLATYVISSAMSVLDSITLANGHPYSYPPTVKTYCSYGRPYHFWMAAYLAKALTQKGHSPKSAFLAAHLTGVGYEALADTGSRNHWGALAVDADATSNNDIRTNVIFDDAGANFGALIESGTKLSPLDLDLRHALLFQRAEQQEKLSEDEAEDLYERDPVSFLLRWRKLFTPDAGLRPWEPGPV